MMRIQNLKTRMESRTNLILSIQCRTKYQLSAYAHSTDICVPFLKGRIRNVAEPLQLNCTCFSSASTCRCSSCGVGVGTRRRMHQGTRGWQSSVKRLFKHTPCASGLVCSLSLQFSTFAPAVVVSARKCSKRNTYAKGTETEKQQRALNLRFVIGQVLSLCHLTRENTKSRRTSHIVQLQVLNRGRTFPPFCKCIL